MKCLLLSYDSRAVAHPGMGEMSVEHGGTQGSGRILLVPRQAKNLCSKPRGGDTGIEQSLPLWSCNTFGVGMTFHLNENTFISTIIKKIKSGKLGRKEEKNKKTNKCSHQQSRN